MQQLSSLATDSRAANFGDGCFTTIKIINQQPQLLHLHVNRLIADSAALGIPLADCFDPSVKLIDAITQLIQTVAAESTESVSVLKVLISRGNGGRGYSTGGCSRPHIIVSHHQYPSTYNEAASSAIKVNISPVRLGHQPLLAGIKHLNRLEQVLIKQKLSTTQFDDCLVCDQLGNVVESSAGNVFVLTSDNQWTTPQLSDCGVKGVLRQSVLQYFDSHGIANRVREIAVEELEYAGGVFICNALMGCVSIKHIQLVSKSIQLPNQQALISQINQWINQQ